MYFSNEEMQIPSQAMAQMGSLKNYEDLWHGIMKLFPTENNKLNVINIFLLLGDVN